LESAHAFAVGSPIYFDGVSAQLKLVMDRCNCITPLVRRGDGWDFRPLWPRTRRGVFVTACSIRHPYEHAERSVRGYLKWIGARWEETIAWRHEDNDTGSVSAHPELLEQARAAGRRLIESPALAPGRRSSGFTRRRALGKCVAPVLNAFSCWRTSHEYGSAAQRGTPPGPRARA